MMISLITKPESSVNTHSRKGPGYLNCYVSFNDKITSGNMSFYFKFAYNIISEWLN